MLVKNIDLIFNLSVFHKHEFGGLAVWKRHHKKFIVIGKLVCIRASTSLQSIIVWNGSHLKGQMAMITAKAASSRPLEGTKARASPWVCVGMSIMFIVMHRGCCWIPFFLSFCLHFCALSSAARRIWSRHRCAAGRRAQHSRCGRPAQGVSQRHAWPSSHEGALHALH